MKKVREVVYDFKGLLDKERLSDQIGMSNRMIYNHLLSFRGVILKREKLFGKLSSQNYQSYTVPLEEVSDDDMPCVEGSTCILLKSKFPVEQFIDLKSIVTPYNKAMEVKKITNVDLDIIKYKKYSKLKIERQNTYYYFQNSGDGMYLYLWSDEPLFLEAVDITAVFNNPHVIEAMNSCDGIIDPCYNYLDANFVLAPDNFADVFSMAFSTLMKVNNPYTDNYNDGLDSIVSNPSPFK